MSIILYSQGVGKQSIALLGQITYYVVMLEELADTLHEHVTVLSEDIGPRSYLDAASLGRAASYIDEQLRAHGIESRRQGFQYRGDTYENIICEFPGKDGAGRGDVVVGAHYDTVIGTPGADDNASGVAGLLEIARALTQRPPSCTVRLVAFCLEEPPVFRSRCMGSMAYAESLKVEGVRLRGMISLEMLGYYSAEPGSQHYPLPGMRRMYRDAGDFIAFVGNIASRPFTREFKKAFSEHTPLPVESLNTLSAVPGVDFSDHRSFWKIGCQAFMVTDTAFYRNPHYHGPGDRIGTLDFVRMAQCVQGLSGALSSLS